MLAWRLILPVLRRTMSLERLVRLMARPRPGPPPEERIGSVVLVGGRLWRDSSSPCLERSVCIHRELGLAGGRPELVLGLAPDHSGHAWVELAGAALLEPSPPQIRFPELMRFDAGGALIQTALGRPSEDA
jgi:hypothetical protein